MNERVPEFPAVDPILARTRAKAAREVANKEHSKITKQAARAHRHKILTEPYESGSPQLMDLLNGCPRLIEGRPIPPDYADVALFGRAQADDLLYPNKLSDSEAVTIMQFMNTQAPPIWPNANSWLVVFDILAAENIIRPTIVNAPVEAEPDPVEPEANPFPFDSNPRSQHALWDMAQYKREKERELSVPFRQGASSLGIELSEKDMRRLHQKLDQMRLPMTSTNVRRAGIALFGERVNLTDAERADFETNAADDALDGEGMKKKYGFRNDYSPNRGANARS